MSEIKKRIDVISTTISGAVSDWKKIDGMGGMLAAIDRGYPQTEIANAAYNFQQQLDIRERVMVYF